MSDKFLITELHCKGCNAKIERYGACLEVSIIKWINGYWTDEAKSEYYCLDCAPKVEVIIR